MNRFFERNTLKELLAKKVSIPLGLLLLVLLLVLLAAGLLVLQVVRPVPGSWTTRVAMAGGTIQASSTSLRLPTVTARITPQPVVESSEPAATVVVTPPPQRSTEGKPTPTSEMQAVATSTRTTVTPAAMSEVRQPYVGIWISAEELAQLPTSGAAWEHLKAEADRSVKAPKLRNQDQDNNVLVLAKALVYARTGESQYREEVIENLMDAIGTEEGGRTLALGRELVAYVIAADLINLPANPDEDMKFRAWLREVLTEKLDGSTLRRTQEERPNNWGTHAGASRAAVALYLQDDKELERTAVVFKGYLGDRSAYDDFIYGDLHWQADPDNPVGVNPAGATKEGHSIDGALPEEMRRGGDFQWPPEETGYPWEAMQGALVQAEILCRAGYPTWEWEDQALLRAAEFLYGIGWLPVGDDDWQPWLLNNVYGTKYPTVIVTQPGKNMGWTDWTHSELRAPRGQREGC